MIPSQHTPPNSNALGQHWLIEFYDCNAAFLKQTKGIEMIMNQAALKAGATIVGSNFHQFSPYGVSGVVIIAESHLTIHTWPEHAYAAVDIFTCGTTVQAQPAVDYLQAQLGAKKVEMKHIERGIYTNKAHNS